LADVVYTYDNKGNNDSILEPTINGIICEKTYNELNYKTQEVYYNFIESKNQFIKSTKIEYTVDEKGIVSKYSLYLWADEQWVFNHGDNYNYNTVGDAIHKDYYYFNYENENFLKKTRYYNSSQINTISVLPNFLLSEGIVFDQDFSLENGNFNFDSGYSLTKEDLFVWNNDKWEMGYEILYYYSDLQTSVDAVTTLNSTIKVFPNPTDDFITIDLGNNQFKDKLRLNVYSSDGQLVYETSIKEQSLTIDLSNFGKSGLYLINILNQQNKILESRKLILKD
jgi:hypothetical protein